MNNSINSEKSPLRGAKADLKYFTVSEVAELFNRTLEQSFPEVFFQGEISQLTRATSGHMYFTLKDAKSQLAAVMWKGFISQLTFRPEPGLSVLCMGRPNVYHATGKLQIVVYEMHPAGEGLLQKKFLQLKEKLEKEGLFAVSRKRALPYLPKAIGVVTSSQGAVIHDIMVKLKERMPPVPVYLVDVRVQGEGAAQEIAEGVRRLNASGLVDVIIVARGGGSLEDLWAFNEEVVVRAIFASVTPVVSGVGHEVDVTLSDLAADVRAPTPTAAAEIVVPKRVDLLITIDQMQKRLSDYQRWLTPFEQRVDELGMRLGRAVAALFEGDKVLLGALEVRMRALKPAKILEMFSGRIEILGRRLYASGSRKVSLVKARVDVLELTLRQSVGVTRFANLTMRVSSLEEKIAKSAMQAVAAKSAYLDTVSAKLEAISPKKVMSRGYSIVRKGSKVIRSPKEVRLSDVLEVMLYEGCLDVAVRSINEDVKV